MYERFSGFSVGRCGEGFLKLFLKYIATGIHEIPVIHCPIFFLSFLSHQIMSYSADLNLVIINSFLFRLIPTPRSWSWCWPRDWALWQSQVLKSSWLCKLDFQVKHFYVQLVKSRTPLGKIDLGKKSVMLYYQEAFHKITFHLIPFGPSSSSAYPAQPFVAMPITQLDYFGKHIRAITWCSMKKFPSWV